MASICSKVQPHIESLDSLKGLSLRRRNKECFEGFCTDSKIFSILESNQKRHGVSTLNNSLQRLEQKLNSGVLMRHAKELEFFYD